MTRPPWMFFSMRAGKTFNMTHAVQRGSTSKLPARLLPSRRGSSAASAPAPSPACASGSTELRLLEYIAMAIQINTVLGLTGSVISGQYSGSTFCDDLEANGDCVLTAQWPGASQEILATVGSASRQLLTITGDYIDFYGPLFGEEVPKPGLKLSLSASNLDTTTASVVVVSNTYPVTPTLTVLGGMLVVYLPPYDTPVTDPELVLKFVVLVRSQLT